MRRFGPPIALFLLAISLLAGRLWDVQVTEHATWAREAANLVRSYHVQPYVRGAIRDRAGRIMVRDEQVYELEFVWRDFRRGHPLGQVAMARSLLVGSPFSLDAARRDLSRYAAELVSMTPGDVDAFARGEPITLGTTPLPGAVEEAQLLRGVVELDVEVARREQRRAARASDLRFYLHRLLALSTREERRLREAIEGGRADGDSYVTIASRVTGTGAEEVLAGVRQRASEALGQLSRLSAEIRWPDDAAEDAKPPEGVDPELWPRLPAAERLFALIEARRATVEDETADALFDLALGLPAWRLDGHNLSWLELGWIDRLVGWDRERRREWLARRGEAWPAMAADWVAGHAVARAKLYYDEAEPGLAALPERTDAERAAAAARRDAEAADGVLSAVAHVFRADAARHSAAHAAPENWRRIDALDGFDDVSRTLVRGGQLDRDSLAEVFPFQSAAARASRTEAAALLVEVLGADLQPVALALDRAPLRAYQARLRELRTGDSIPAAPAPHTALDAARHLIAVTREHRDDWDPEDRAAMAALLSAVEVHAQTRWRELLEGLGGDERAPVGVAPEAVGRAVETRRYVVRDRGSRPRVVGGEPTYELVHLVTRHPREFAGFRVRPTTVRVRPMSEADGADLNRHPDGEEVARHLMGKVRHPYLVDLLRQRSDEVELAEMQRKLDLPEEDRATILELVREAWQPDERMGGSGIEGWFDPELRGEEGYLEIQGLQDRRGGNREPIYRPAVDGRDVHLTLDLELQRAAERLLREPRPPADPLTDGSWFLNPVGAIVLADVNGEIVVAASTPLSAGLPPPPFTDGQRAASIERTLRRPGFSPAGSIVKPLLAAYAVDQLSVSFEEGLVVCDDDQRDQGTDPKASGRAGWGRIDCNVRYGHSPLVTGVRIRMRDALKRSCNTYFACLGETRFTGPTMQAAYATFGLGQETGVRWDAGTGRSGLVDSYRFNSASPLAREGGPGEVARQFLGNGLAHLDVNVVQMVRAYAGLATGWLPEMRLVRRIGDDELAPGGRELGLSDKSLSRVREALRAVVQEDGGSGHGKNLSPAQLGVELSAKTGSADYRDLSPPPGAGDAFDERVLSRKHAWFAGWFPSNQPRYVFVVYCHDTSTTASHIATWLTGDFLALPETQAFLAAEGLR